MPGGERVRPTKLCLDALGVAPPTIDRSLADLDAGLLVSAQSLPERYGSGAAQRIRSLKDRVWFKVKTGRWRGAATRLTDVDLAREASAAREQGIEPDTTSAHRWWLGAAGWREDGSPTDFYSDVAVGAHCPRTPAKPDGVDTDRLLPHDWDRRRLRAELAFSERDVYRRVMIMAAARSLRTGKVITAGFERFDMGVVVRADRGDQFVALIARNVFDPTRLAVMLDSLPGVDHDDWQPEPGGIAGIQPGAGEVIWSAVLTPEAADQILELEPRGDAD
ncbi:hypothetical protein [Arthrobacter sp. NEB 688]|uniref:hypothetical protein n=1 Tax=Arthrobacter sp. NEB 688 TaxID=904039 RepID=UPI0015660B5D|nr:hypothetical protein [Arthrobacter sp. NEB 688]QKE83392.1 hypothetical protein HL663_05140 [Arthrobacter sp. NEB 688]